MLYVCFLFARLNSAVPKAHVTAVIRKALCSVTYVPGPYTFTCGADQKLEIFSHLGSIFCPSPFPPKKKKAELQNYTGNVLNLKLVAENFKNN